MLGKGKDEVKIKKEVGKKSKREGPGKDELSRVYPHLEKISKVCK